MMKTQQPLIIMWYIKWSGDLLPIYKAKQILYETKCIYAAQGKLSVRHI